MTSFNRKTLLVLALAAGAGAARAEGLYVGGGIGVPDYHSTITGVDGSGSGVGLKLYGGADLSRNFGIEAGYVDLGHLRNGNGEVRSRGLFVDAVGRVDIAPQWSVLGTAGVADARFSGPSNTDWSAGLKLGLGVQYDLSKSLALRAQYDRYHFGSVYDGSANIGLTTVGLKFSY